MKLFKCCVKKDCLEFLRTKKSIILFGILLALGIMVVMMTKSLPFMIEELGRQIPDFVSGSEDINSMFKQLFPEEVKGSIGIWASEVGGVYAIVVVFIVCNLLPNEIKKGKWIFPIAVGYKNPQLIFSKCLVYGVGTALPAFVMYNLYYIIASCFFTNNYELSIALFNSVIMSLLVFSITDITILCSMLYKHSFINALVILAIITMVPDILKFFEFGKYFPTYLFTHLYTSSAECTDVIIPLLELVIIQLILAKFAVKKSYQIEVSR